MQFETLTLEITNGVGLLTLNRPNEMNAFNGQMAQDLFDAAIECDTNPAIRSVLVTGSGKMFSAGGDLKEFLAAGDAVPAFVTRMATVLHTAIARLNRMDPPVVMAINGTAAGGGFSFALSGDYSIASQKAKFVSAYTASGLSPDASSTYFLAKHVGLYRAKELVLTNRLLNANEALEWGIVNKVVEPDELLEEAMKMARQFAAGPTKAYGQAKHLLHTAFSESMETQLEFESQGITSMMRTQDARSALDAFVNKRKPEFSGE